MTILVVLSWGCGGGDTPLADGEMLADVEHNDGHQLSSDTVESDDVSTSRADIFTPSWCEHFCSAMDEGCTDGQAFTDKDCLSECITSAVGACPEAWVAAETCIEFQTDWSCGEAGHAAPSDMSCTDELATLRECLGPPDPCVPSPCGVHESCIMDDEGEAFCSSDAEEWCTGITLSMEEACPDFVHNAALQIALCIRNAQGPCALECAMARDCLPTDTEWSCDPAEGVLPKNGECMDELNNMVSCTMANGSVP